MAHLITIAAAADMLNQHAVTFAKDIKQQFRQGLEFENILPFVECDETYTAENVTPSDVMQPYQGAFTPNNSEEWDAVDNRLRPIKIDLEYTEEQLMKFFSKWKVQWAEAGKDPLEWTYPKYMIEQVLMAKALEELNKIAWDGEFAAPTPGVAGSYLDSQDGYKIGIANGITNGLIVPVNSGSYTSSDIVDKMEAWLDAIPEVATAKGGTVLMGKGKSRLYSRDYRNTHQQSPWEVLQNNARKLMVNDYEVEIKGIASMSSSSRWIFLPGDMSNMDQNMIIGTRKGYPRYPVFEFFRQPRKLQVVATFYRFFGFEYYNNIYVNDQA